MANLNLEDFYNCEAHSAEAIQKIKKRLPTPNSLMCFSVIFFCQV